MSPLVNVKLEKRNFSLGDQGRANSGAEKALRLSNC